MKISWLHLSVYLASLVISLGLNLYFPDVLAVLCNPLPIGNLNDLDSAPTIDRTPSRQHNLDREK
jgi:hypothetical protein